MRWRDWTNLRRWVAALSLLTTAVLLGGCASPPGAANGESATGTVASGSDEASALKRAQLRLELSEGYYQRGQLDVALAEADKSLAEKSDYVPAYNMRALIEMAMGNMPAAESDFRRALSLNPADTDTLHNYGWFLCQQRRYPQSFEMFRKALAQPGYRNAPRTYLALGVCEYRSGDWVAAENDLRRGFSLEPANPALATNLAFVLYRLGKYKDALFYISRVNTGPTVSAQSLWIGILAARRAGDGALAQAWTQQLIQKFPDSREAIHAQQGRFNDDVLFDQ